MYILFLAFLSEIFSGFYLYKFILSNNKPKLINHFIFLVLFSWIPVGLFLLFACQQTINNQENKHVKQQNYQYNNE